MSRFLFAGRLSLGAVVTIVWLASNGSTAAAASPASLVRKANRAYKEKRYDEALAAYDRAGEALPEAAEVPFDRGAALYRKGEFEEAETAFAEAARRAEDARLRSRARYNEGNALAKRAEGRLEKAPREAVDLFEKAAARYRASFRDDPGFRPAAHNLEVTRRSIHALREMLRRQAEQAKQAQQQREKMAEELKDLMREQEDLRREAASRPPDSPPPAKDERKQARPDTPEKEETTASEKEREQDAETAGKERQKEQERRGEQTRKDAAKQEPAGGEPGDRKPSSSPEDLVGKQEQLREKTRKLAENASEQPGHPPSTKEAGDRLRDAAEAQASAAEHLKRRAAEQAGDDQDKALEKMREALRSLTEGEKKDGQPSGDAAEGEKKQPGEEKPQPAPRPEEPSQEPPDETPGSAPSQDVGETGATLPPPDMAPVDATAKDILEKEKELREQRRLLLRGQNKPVERDW